MIFNISFHNANHTTVDWFCYVKNTVFNWRVKHKYLISKEFQHYLLKINENIDEKIARKKNLLNLSLFSCEDQVGMRY